MYSFPANCGATQDLLKCSRCHNAYFCSVKCQKVRLFRLLLHQYLYTNTYTVYKQAYWPFHKTSCHRNEFADAVEEAEPKFARWMRSHGKMAVLKDDEVDRLERASHATSGPSRQDVMESMYGRLLPKPQGMLILYCHCGCFFYSTPCILTRTHTHSHLQNRRIPPKR